MSFAFGTLCRFTVRWLASFRWTARRAAVVLAFLVLYPLLELVIWAGLLLDDILFRGYRRQPVDAPVFIVGNFRSGTTFLHRLLSKDAERFTTMQMWEVLLSPSVAGRRVVAAVAAVVGRPARWIFGHIEGIWHQKNVMHEVSLTAPEEDDYVLLHIWSGCPPGCWTRPSPTPSSTAIFPKRIGGASWLSTGAASSATCSPTAKVRAASTWPRTRP